MRLLFDTNIVLDVLLDRQPYALPAAELISLVDRGQLEAMVGATTVTTLHYLASKAAGRKAAAGYLESLLALFDVAPVDGPVLARALALDFGDFEDAVLHGAAETAGATGIVSRDNSGFLRATLPVYHPADLLAMLRSLD